MFRVCLPRFARLLPLGLAFLLAFQVASIVPLHHLHGVETTSPRSSPDKTPLPHDCRCDFCLAFSALDHATAAPALVPGLAEIAFAVVAAYPSFECRSPFFFFRARGPPLPTA